MSNSFRDLLAPNQLNSGDNLFSGLSGFKLSMQQDGNLVLYAIDDTNLPRQLPAFPPGFTSGSYPKAIWASGTNGTDANRCVMQEDGNLVVYDVAGTARWASGTNGNHGAFLRCQDDGNLVVYSFNGGAWSSNTFAGPRETPSNAIRQKSPTM